MKTINMEKIECRINNKYFVEDVNSFLELKGKYITEKKQVKIKFICIWHMRLFFQV